MRTRCLIHAPLLLVAMLLLSAIGCAAKPAPPRIDYVIHISVDGLRSLPAQPGEDGLYLTELIDAGKLPHFQRLREEGASTDNARTDFTHTTTLPNHTSMITGRPVLVPDGASPDVAHLWIDNRNADPTLTLHANHPSVEYIASTFDVVHDAGLSTAIYTGKEKFAVYDLSYNAEHGRESIHGRDKIDLYLFDLDTARLNAQLLHDLAQQRFNYVFLHYYDPDFVGHTRGWGSAAWQQSVINIDGFLGQLLAFIDSDPAFKDRTAIILTADHGGGPRGHGDPTLIEVHTIPVYVWGPGVAPGADLYELNLAVRANPGRDPGTSRPDYQATPPPIRNGDTGNLALDLLGLPAVPGSLINADQSLRVAAPPSHDAPDP